LINHIPAKRRKVKQKVAKKLAPKIQSLFEFLSCSEVSRSELELAKGERCESLG
jgi:hypothetical protein